MPYLPPTPQDVKDILPSAASSLPDTLLTSFLSEASSVVISQAGSPPPDGTPEARLNPLRFAVERDYAASRALFKVLSAQGRDTASVATDMLSRTMKRLAEYNDATSLPGEEGRPGAALVENLTPEPLWSVEGAQEAWPAWMRFA